MLKLTSRKFWMAIVAVVTSLVAMFTGSISPDVGVKIILGAVAVYLGAEGIVDFGYALKATKPKPKTKKK